MGKGFEPFNTRELERFLANQPGSIRRPPSGGGHYVYVSPSGVEVRCPNGSKKPVSPDTARAAAAAVGMTYPDMCTALGHAPAKHGRPKGRDEGPPSMSKREVMEVVGQVRSAVVSLHDRLQNGIHDPALYHRVAAGLRPVLAEVTALQPATDGAGYSSPDDRGYRPTKPDALLTGPARATGLTAKAAKRKNAMTRWEHERENGRSA